MFISKKHIHNGKIKGLVELETDEIFSNELLSELTKIFDDYGLDIESWENEIDSTGPSPCSNIIFILIPNEKA